MNQQEQVIPIVFCFDNNYVIPASVAIYSLLENADKHFFYRFYVLHSNITEDNIAKLQETIYKFENSTLEFLNMNNRFDELFKKTKAKAHYSKEIFYKYLAPELFNQYNSIIISDVDVVFTGDVSQDYLKYCANNEIYVAACKGLWKNNYNNFNDLYKKDFSNDEIKKLGYAGGYYIFNLHNMRKDNICNKLIEFTEKNIYRLIQPEQDTISLVCDPKITCLPVNELVCSYAYDMYKNKEDYTKDTLYSAEDVSYALENPIQLHYATNIKPWNTPNCTKSEIWYHYLYKTPFWHEQMSKLELKIKKHILLEFSSKKLRKRFVCAIEEL